MESIVGNARKNFDQYEYAIKNNNPNADYKNKSEIKRIRSTCITYFEGSETVQLNDKE